MKYSIRGTLSISDGEAIVNELNKYTLWRLITNQYKDDEDNSVFNFEVWLNTEEDKTNLFNNIKPFVDQYGEVVDWHMCTHDEEIAQPCVIVEEYRGE